MKPSYLFVFFVLSCSLLIGKKLPGRQVNDESTKRNIVEGIVLENNEIKAVFSKKNGALIDFTSKITGWHIQNRAELGLSFQLLVPVPGKRNNPVYGIKQQLQSFKLSDDKKTLTFHWGKLVSERGGVLDVHVKGIVTAGDDGLTFNMSVENKSPYMIEAVSYPAIGDLSRPNDVEKMECMTVGYSGMDRNSLMPAFSNHEGYYGVDYPTMSFSLPELFMLVGTPGQGLYIGCHDISLKEMVSYTFELKPGWGLSYMNGCVGGGDFPREGETGKVPARIELNVWHFPFVNPNETATLSPIVFNPYHGSWHYGVDKYKTWRKTWFKRPATPAWAQEVHSWQQLHINSPEDEFRCQYKDLVKYGSACAKHHVSAIQLVGWNKGGQDRGNPSHDTDPGLGTWQDLKDAIAKIEAMGVHINLFNKYTWADQSSEWFRKELIKYACKDPYGDYHVTPGYQYFTPVQLNDINTRRLIPMCHHSKAWRNIANKEFKKVVDLGASGMLYDENQHHGGMNYCWDKTHGHHVPAFVFGGDIPLVQGFRQISDKQAPNFLYAGEANYDVENSWYDLAYFRFDPFSHTAIKRYIDPYGLIMAAVPGFNDRVMLNACLKNRYVISYEPYNFKGHLDDFPLTLEYGKKIDALRTTYKDFLWDGEYRDILEATVTSNGRPFGSYAVFRHSTESRRGVVVTNNDRKDAIEVEVKIDNSNRSLVFVTPENPVPQPVSGKIKIPALSVVFVFEREKLNEDVFCFYYNWYGNPEQDGKYIHWAHPVIKSGPSDTTTGKLPGGDNIAANFYPALGPYSIVPGQLIAFYKLHLSLGLWQVPVHLKPILL